jgi:hypothetical protein
MPDPSSHLPVVREWLVSLGVLCAISASRREAEMKLAAFAPLLVREFPTAAFTSDSLSHVAAANPRGFPSYGELVTALREWWHPRRPLPPALPPPAVAPPHAATATPEEREYIRALVEDMTARVRARADDTVTAAPVVGARHLSPGQLDAINPLPNGRLRVAGAAS